MKYFLCIWLLMSSIAEGYEFTKPDGSKIELKVVGLEFKKSKMKTVNVKGKKLTVPNDIKHPPTADDIVVVKFYNKEDPKKPLKTSVDKLSKEDLNKIKQWFSNANDYYVDINGKVLNKSSIIDIFISLSAKVIRVDDDLIFVSTRSRGQDKIVCMKNNLNLTLGDKHPFGFMRVTGSVKRQGGDIPFGKFYRSTESESADLKRVPNFDQYIKMIEEKE